MKLLFLAFAAVSLTAQQQTPAEMANQAEQLLRAGDTNNGVTLLNQAAQAPGATAESEDHIGFLFAAIGRSPDALPHFQKAISLNADFAPRTIISASFYGWRKTTNTAYPNCKPPRA